ncbi:SdiA-regulated domain-containing protein [Xylophilus sp. GOD-11R]|uniref:SdiA-regulated domain-containing protein n=1 Tax=Xylophilus sp. GOD-11R TaxID=3089814 RepID=UPI00298C2417|nr:SdiA-regulated domain-containing protein [Xylophilus sp. GOD-11R]WPB55811.1 SdiA-regulated domain-containing protein [Xylophilus sp. GOD-11R]
MKLHLRKLAIVGGALALAAWLGFIAIRYYHLDNQAGRWWRGDRIGADWNDSGKWAGESTLWLPEYRFDIENRRIEGVDRNLSGLAWDSDDNRLLATVNRPASLLILSTEGAVRSRHVLADTGDAEGIAYLGDDRVAVLLEGQRMVRIFRLPTAGHVGPMTAERSVQLDMPDSGNDGPEGLAYDQANDTLYITKERAPRGILKVPHFQHSARARATPMDMPEWVAAMPFVTDLASIEFDPVNRSLLLLSDESRMLVEIDEDGSPISTNELPASFGQLPVPQAEGVAVDDQGTIFMVSEPNLFYRLKRDTPVL